MYLRKPVKERFLNMGNKRRWFDRPSLHSKIEEVSYLTRPKVNMVFRSKKKGELNQLYF